MKGPRAKIPRGLKSMLSDEPIILSMLPLAHHGGGHSQSKHRGEDGEAKHRGTAGVCATSGGLIRNSRAVASLGV